MSRFIRHDRILGRPSRSLLVGLVALAVALAGVGVAMAGGRDGNIVVTRDGTVVDGREITGYLHVKADNVTIRNSTIRYDGSHALRIFPGASGTVVENSRIFCEAPRTNGVVFGNYTARRVRLTGCRNGFMYSASAPATIVDSTWNGRPVNVGVDLGPAPVPTGTTPAPSPSAAPSTATPRPEPARTESPAPRSTASTSRIPGTFPGPGNTGVPAGTTLKPSGSITVETDGKVISGLNISGCVTVKARNVVIRKSRITCGGTYSIRTDGADALLVEDVEINGRGVNSAAVCCGDYTLRRVEITNVIDGPRLGSNTVVEDSWIHHLTRAPGSHNDVLQTTGASNIVVRGNSLEAYNPDTRDPFNACLMIGSTTGPIVSNLLFERNYCNGGNYSIGIRTDLNAENIRLQNNVFGRDHRYGVIAHPDQEGITWSRSTNLWVDSRRPVL